MDVSTIILGLISFLQILFFFILRRLFETQDKLYISIETSQKVCRDKIEKEVDTGRLERDSMKKEYTSILDKHYVTTGQLNTLEEKLIGQIKILSTSIEHLTSAIKLTFEDKR